MEAVMHRGDPRGAGRSKGKSAEAHAEAVTEAQAQKPEKVLESLRETIDFSTQDGIGSKRKAHHLSESTVAAAHTGSLGAGMSKNAMKKRLKSERLKEKKLERRAREKMRRKLSMERRRSELEIRLGALSPSEREAEVERRRQRVIELRTQERGHVLDVRQSIQNSEHQVCIDLDWHSQHSERELASLIKQLAYSYSAVRKATFDGRKGVHLHLTSMSGPLKDLMDLKSTGWAAWPIGWSEEDLATHYKDRLGSLVYLTHESPNLLATVHKDKMYIIGGMVDHNRSKGSTLRKAEALNIETARLDLSMQRIRFVTGTTVLTVNHVVEILLEAVNGKSWHDAVKDVSVVARVTYRSLVSSQSTTVKANSPDMSTQVMPTRKGLVEPSRASDEHSAVASAAASIGRSEDATQSAE